MGYRTQNDPVTERERAFMLASTMLALEDGDTPVLVKHFSNNRKKE